MNARLREANGRLRVLRVARLERPSRGVAGRSRSRASNGCVPGVERQPGQTPSALPAGSLRVRERLPGAHDLGMRYCRRAAVPCPTSPSPPRSTRPNATRGQRKPSRRLAAGNPGYRPSSTERRVHFYERDGAARIVNRRFKWKLGTLHSIQNCAYSALLSTSAPQTADN